MNPEDDALTDAAVAAAEATLPIYVVAESPDGQVLSHDNGYPDDDTAVWLAASTADRADTTMGDLYAQYGDDLIAYAEPEEYRPPVAAALTEPERQSGIGAAFDALRVPPVTAGMTAEQVAAATADRVAERLRHPSAHLPDGPTEDDMHHIADRIRERQPITAAMAADAIDYIEAFLDEAEDLLGITAALNGPGVIPRPVQRMAVGENPAAQQQVIDAFEAHYRDDVDEMIEDVLGPRPDPDTPDHDAEAWDALADEARLWHAHRLASKAAVAAALRATTPT